MQNILIPTDFSSCASNALKFALELAAKVGSKVFILNVIYPNEGVDNSVYNAFWIDEYYARRKSELEQWVDTFRQLPGFGSIEIQCECETGYPVSAIKKYAQKIHADLIVMGTMGATGLRDTLLGSTTAGVISAANIPLFAIPPQAPFVSRAEYVFATDLNWELDDRSKEVLHRVLDAQKATVQVLHVLAGQEKDQPRADTPERDSRLLFFNHPYHYHYRSGDDIPNTIRQFAQEIQADGLMVVAQQHSFLYKLFFQQVSKALAQKITVPVLVLMNNKI